jgi:hypothetical protein
MLARGVRWGESLSSRRALCAECTGFSEVSSNAFGVKSVQLDSFLSENDFRDANKVARGIRNVDDLPCLDGVPVGRLALYSAAITLQKTDWETLDDEFLAAYRSDVVASYLTAIAGERILQQLSPSILYQSNGLYPTGNVLSHVAAKLGVRSYYLLNGNNRARFDDSFTFAEGNFYTQVKFLRGAWRNHYHLIPLTSSQIQQVSDHILALLLGKTLYTYSTRKSHSEPAVIKRLRPKQKLVVLCMSSWDELMAAQAIGHKSVQYKTVCFANQIEWLKETIEFFRDRPDMLLVIRPHPREFAANLRDPSAKDSEHGRRVRSALEGSLPSNVVVNWPEENVSFYDLLDKACLVLNGWSSAGEEASLLGIPSLVAFPEFCNYPADLDFNASSREEYFSRIDEAVNSGWSLERVRRFFRWRALYSARSEFGLPLMGAHANRTKPNKFERLVARVVPDYMLKHSLRNLAHRQQPLDEVNTMIMNKLPTLAHLPSRMQKCGSLKEETAALKFQLRRISQQIYPEPIRSLGLQARLCDGIA